MLKLRQLLSATILCTTLLVSCALAQTNLTQILDTITNPNGTLFNGTVVITWNGYSGTGTGSVSRLSASAMVYTGALSVLLVPTTTASTGTYYSVVYSSSDGTVTWTEVWQVPPSTTPLTLSQVRQSSTESSGSAGSGSSGGGTQYATLPITISQVSSLSSDLSAINGSLTSLTTQVTNLANEVSTGNIGTIQSELTSLTSTVNGLGTTVSGLSSTSTANTNAIAGLTSSSTSLTSTVNANGTALNGLTNTVASLNSTVTSLGSTVSSQASSLANLNANASALSSTVTTNGSALTALTSTVTALNTTVGNNSSSITSLTANLGAVTTGANANTGTLNALSATVGGLNSAVTNLTNSVNGISATINSITASGSNAVFVDDETPTGTINGSNTAFALANPPAPAVSLSLYRNGLAQTAGTDFSLNGSAITFTAPGTPRVGDLLLAYYRVAGTGASVNFTDGEAPGGSANGTNLAFTLANAPNPSASLKLYKNGVLLQLGGDYTLKGSTITFAGTSTTPQTGDSLLASYRH